MIIEIALWILAVAALIGLIFLFTIKRSAQPQASQSSAQPLWLLLAILCLTAATSASAGWVAAVISLKNVAAEEAAKQIQTYEQNANTQLRQIVAANEEGKRVASQTQASLQRLREDVKEVESLQLRAKDAQAEIANIVAALKDTSPFKSVESLTERLAKLERLTAPIDSGAIKLSEVAKMQSRLSSLMESGRLTLTSLEIRQGEDVVTITPATVRVSSASGNLVLDAHRPTIEVSGRGDAQIGLGFANGRPFGSVRTNDRSSPLTALAPQ